jgi:hypothetical protein
VNEKENLNIFEERKQRRKDSQWWKENNRAGERKCVCVCECVYISESACEREREIMRANDKGGEEEDYNVDLIEL